MPESRASVLEYKAATELRPGESGLRLKDDPYYGKVDIGPAPAPKTDDKALRRFEEKERGRISQLPAEQRPAAEEKLAKDLKRRRDRPTATPHDPNAPFPDLPASASADDLAVVVSQLEESIGEGTHALNGEEQNHVEVLTGKRLQQRASQEPPRPPEEIVEPPPEEKPPPGSEPPPLGGETPPPARGLEPPERDRDKTKAAKPGESARS